MNDDMQQPTPLNINQQPDLEPQAPPPQPGQQFKPETPLNKPKKSKKKIVLIILLLLVLTGGAAAAYFLFFKKDAAAPAPQPQSQQTQEVPKKSAPQSLVYYDSDDESAAKLQTITISDTKLVDPKLTLEGGVKSDVNGEKIVVVGRVPGETPVDTVMLSVDSGKTYKKIWQAKAPTFQTTSVKLSANNEKLALSALDGSEDSEGNTTYEFSITGNVFEPTSLFTSKSSGVFLHGYNTETQAIYFSEGCFGCGASGSDKIYEYKISSKLKEPLIESDAIIEYNNVVFNDRFTTMTFLENSMNEQGESGMEPGGPFVIKNYDIVNNKITTLKSIGEKNKTETVTIGKVMDSEAIYYTYKNQVISINNAKEAVLFESSQPIISASYVSDESIVAQVGKEEKFNLNLFTIRDKKSTVLLENKSFDTVLIGTTYTN